MGFSARSQPTDSSQAKLLLAGFTLVVILFFLGQSLLSNPGWELAELDDLAEDLQVAVHNCLEENSEAYDLIAGAEGRLNPATLSFEPGYQSLIQALRRSVKTTLGPGVEARIGPSIGRRRVLDAVVGSYLISSKDKGNFRIEPHAEKENTFEVMWPKLPDGGPSFSIMFRAEFDQEGILSEVVLLAVTPLKM